MADETAKRITEFIAPLRVAPGSKVRLAKDFDPGYKAEFVKKRDGRELLKRGVEIMTEYQTRLAAQDTYGVLVVLQALDAAGKDGTIRHVMSGVNPQGVTVHSFKVPSPEEINHDFLWRYARCLPVAARSASSTARTTRRSSWSACTPRTSSASACPRRRAAKTCGSCATATSTTGSAT